MFGCTNGGTFDSIATVNAVAYTQDYPTIHIHRIILPFIYTGLSYLSATQDLFHCLLSDKCLSLSHLDAYSG